MAVKLMLGSSDVERAANMVHTICAELSEEAMNLRRIMKAYAGVLQRGANAPVSA